MRSWVVVLTFLAACNSGTDEPMDAAAVDAQVDAGPVVDSGTLLFEVGTGQDFYIPFDEGDVVAFSQGTQASGSRYGGFHIFGAFRSQGFNPTEPTMTFSVITPDDDVMHGSVSRRKDLQPAGEFQDFFAVPIILMDCCALLDREAIMRVEISDMDGRLETAEKRFSTESACIDLNTSSNVCR